MKLKDWGEKSLVDLLLQTFNTPQQIKGIGDDCAVIPINDQDNLLVTVDALTEGIHFLPTISPEDLGYKSVMVNVSDIASMGGITEYLFLACSLPSNMDVSWFESYIKGFKKACDKTNTVLLGGDTVGSKNSIFLSITAIGRAKKSHTKYRSAAKEGDIVCLTGELGSSPVGLKYLIAQLPLNDDLDVNHIIKSHVRPEAHSQQGQWLAKKSEVHAMIDVSDGVEKDLQNLTQASHVGANVCLDKLPIANAAKKICSLQGWDYETLALSGGEEYCLLLTVAPDAHTQLTQDFEKTFNYPLYSIGQITNDHTIKYFRYNQQISINPVTYDHFKE